MRQPGHCPPRQVAIARAFAWLAQPSALQTDTHTCGSPGGRPHRILHAAGATLPHSGTDAESRSRGPRHHPLLSPSILTRGGSGWESGPRCPLLRPFPIAIAEATPRPHLPCQFKLSALLICPDTRSHHHLRNRHLHPLQATQEALLWPPCVQTLEQCPSRTFLGEDLVLQLPNPGNLEKGC